MSSDRALGAALSPGTTVGKGYELIRAIGTGACGTVYEANASDGRRVALKVMLHADVKSWNEPLRRFVREAQITGALDSPHIVRLLDAGVDGTLNLPYIAMPLMRGFNLDTLVRLGGPLQPTVAARIIRQCCAGLSRAHAAEVIHRDIKPANLFLDHDPSGGVTARVLDFGLAKWSAPDEDLTRPGMCIGTPYFMAPEQIRHSREADCRADVWGLGASLYQALCRRWPYQETKGLGALLVTMQTRDPAPVQDTAPWLDPSLATIVHGCLIRRRAARCPTVADLAEALRPFTAGSDELRAGMFWPVATEVRKRPAPRAEPPTTWHAPPPTVPPDPPMTCAVAVGKARLEDQVDAWCREEWMLRTAPQAPESGPLALEQVARGLEAGTIPWDAQLARAGTTAWRLASLVVFS